MEKKYISSNRYKKTTKSKRNKRRVQSVSYKLAHIDSMSLSRENTQLHENKSKEKQKHKVRIPKMSLKVKILLLLGIVILVLIIARAVLKEEEEGFWDFLISEENNIKSEYSVVVNSADKRVDENYANLAIVELDNKTNGSFIQINKDYSITYDILEKIEKVSNTSYKLYIKEDKLDYISPEVVKTTLESYKSKESVYYKNVSNIKDIKIIDNVSLEINLHEDDPLYIYNLNIPVRLKDKNVTSDNSLQYIINKKKLNFTFENDVDYIVNQFKSGGIDLFMTGDKMAVSQIGNYSYDIYSYRTGETVFLFGNKKSEFFQDKVIRKAIAYSINRAKIIQDIYMDSGDIIDLPYIYSDVQYKYDIYSAQNLLLDNGYILNNGKLCKKNEDGTLTAVNLKLVVNKEDTKKIQIAESIKEDLKQQRNKCDCYSHVGKRY